MTNARELLTRFFESFVELETSVEQCVDLFADDGAFEFPYLATIASIPGLQGRLLSVTFST